MAIPIAHHPKDKKRMYPCSHPRDVARYRLVRRYFVSRAARPRANGPSSRRARRGDPPPDSRAHGGHRAPAGQGRSLRWSRMTGLDATRCTRAMSAGGRSRRCAFEVRSGFRPILSPLSPCSPSSLATPRPLNFRARGGRSPAGAPDGALISRKASAVVMANVGRRGGIEVTRSSARSSSDPSRARQARAKCLVAGLAVDDPHQNLGRARFAPPSPVTPTTPPRYRRDLVERNLGGTAEGGARRTRRSLRGVDPTPWRESSRSLRSCSAIRRNAAARSVRPDDPGDRGAPGPEERNEHRGCRKHQVRRVARNP